MPFLKLFYLLIDWTTSATIIDGYGIPIAEQEAYTGNSRLEIVSNKAFVKGLNQGKNTWCGFVDSM